MVSDNGPQFSSFEFAQFGKDWDFIHDPSGRKYPKSNGMAENGVKIVKGLLKKAEKHKEDPYLALIVHRSTPSSSDNKSPYEKLFGHAMRTLLPDLRNMRKSKNIPASDLPAKFQPKYSDKQRHYYSRSAKELPDIPVGSTVRIRKGNSWPTKAKVNTLRRNRSDLLKSNEQFTHAPPDIVMPVSESTDSPSASHPTFNPDTSQSYRSRLRSSVNPPSRFSFDVER